MVLPLTGLLEWTAGQASPWTVINTFMRAAEALMNQASVEDRDLTAPPGSCADGDRFLIDSPATGDWLGYDGRLAVASGTNASNGWVIFTVAREGFELWVEDEGIKIRYQSGAWQPTTDSAVQAQDVPFTPTSPGFYAANVAAALDELFAATESLQSGGGGGLTTEQIQDMIATFLVQSGLVTTTYDDAGNTLTIAVTVAASNVSYTPTDPGFYSANVAAALDEIIANIRVLEESGVGGGSGGSGDTIERLHVQHTAAQNTNAGGQSSGADLTRTINTTVLNEIDDASLASNQITLPAGTYWIDARVPFYQTARSRAWLYNVTDAANEILGSVTYSGSSGAVMAFSRIHGKFTITSAKTFEIRARVETSNATNGAGVESNFVGTEIYTDVVIEKITTTANENSGTAFPGSPATGDRFFRTDRGIEYYWDGTQWLSVHLHNVGFGAFLGAAADGTSYAAIPYKGTYDLWIERVDGSMLRSGAGGEWDLVFGYVDSANTVTAIATLDGAGDTSLNWYARSASVGAVLSTNARALTLQCDEISGSNTFFGSGEVSFRLVG